MVNETEPRYMIFTEADYRNVELRIMAAHMQYAKDCADFIGDRSKLEPPVFKLGERTDVHDARAARDGITREQAKALNYADWYGVNSKDMFK